MDRTDDETSNNSDSMINDDSHGSSESVDLFDNEDDTIDYNSEVDIPVSPSYGSQESSADQIIEINETQHNIHNANNQDVIEIIDLCATQMPDESYQRNRNNDDVIEILDSPSVLSTRDPPTIRRRRRVTPYPETAIASCSQPRRSQMENPITCPICLENVRNHSPVSTNCGHIFCKNCLQQALQTVKKCPMCKKNTTLKQFHDIYI